MMFEEQENWQLFGIDYKATKDQANEIYLQTQRTKAWHEHQVTQLMISCIAFDTSNPDSMKKCRELCEDHVRASFALSAAVAEISEKVLK